MRFNNQYAEQFSGAYDCYLETLREVALATGLETQHSNMGTATCLSTMSLPNEEQAESKFFNSYCHGW